MSKVPQEDVTVRHSAGEPGARAAGLARPVFPSSLRAKLIIPYVILTVAMAVIGVYVVTRLVAASVRERFINQLYEASRVANDGVVRQERRLLESMRLLAFTDGVPQAMADRDAQRLRDLLSPLALNNNLEVLSAVDLSGREIVTLVQGQVASQGQDFSGLSLVDQVLRRQVDAAGDKFTGLTQSASSYYLFISGPVEDSSGQLSGVLLVGLPLETLLAELKSQALADQAVLDPGGRLIATTLPEPEAGYGLLELEPDALPDLGESELHSVEMYGREYQLLFSPMIVRTQVVGTLAVALPADFVFATGTASRNVISLIFLAGTAAVILVGYLLSQSIALPILRLRDMSQMVAAGDLEHQTGLRQQDEIGELAAAFDTMTLRLRERTAEAARLYAETIRRNAELVTINAQLQAAQQQLIQSEKLAAIGQLTAGIVHDVKNPLAVIKGMAQVLHDDFELDSDVRRHLATIRDSAARANKIVSDLLKFARQSTPEMSHRDLRETIETAARLTGYLAREARVHVVLDLPETPVLALYDSQQIEQVLINLVQNAIQAMPGGGTLRLGLTARDGMMAIVVQDTGIGIPVENLGRIFDPFFTTKPEGEGTGLGLSVSYGIIARHRGQIRVDSLVGQGSTFTVLLPESPDPTLATAVEAGVGVPAGR